MNERKYEDRNFWGLLRIVGKMHEERRKQELAAELEVEQKKTEMSKKPKKRKKRKSKSK